MPGECTIKHHYLFVQHFRSQLMFFFSNNCERFLWQWKMNDFGHHFHNLFIISHFLSQCQFWNNFPDFTCLILILSKCSLIWDAPNLNAKFYSFIFKHFMPQSGVPSFSPIIQKRFLISINIIFTNFWHLFHNLFTILSFPRTMSILKQFPKWNLSHSDFS